MAYKILDHGGLNAESLYELLGKFTPEQRVQMGLYMRVGPEGQAFNILSIDEVVESERGFFGESIPCLIFHVERFVTEPESEG